MNGKISEKVFQQAIGLVRIKGTKFNLVRKIGILERLTARFILYRVKYVS